MVVRVMTSSEEAAAVLDGRSSERRSIAAEKPRAKRRLRWVFKK